MKRPLTVTIASWIVIATGFLGIIGTVISLTSNNPAVTKALHDAAQRSSMSVGSQIAISVIGSALCLVCGAYMLKGRSWSRLAYLSWAAFGLILAAYNAPSLMYVLPGTVKVLALAVVLFLPSSNRFFKSRDP